MKPFSKTCGARAGLAAALACAAICMLCCSITPAAAGASEGLSFIRAHQAADGGFFEPGREGAGQDATTAWCIMALRAAGTDPNAVRSGGRSPVDFLATQSGNWHSVTDYERTLLAAVAAGADPRSFGGVDLAGKVASFQRTGGNIGDAVNSNAFGILAYHAAGLDIPAGAIAWQKSAQNADGGWGNNPGGASNPDMTAASIMALRAAGVEAGDSSISDALGYLHNIQAPDGGFSFQAGASDASATAWCVQAIVVAGQDPGGAEWSAGGATPRDYLLAMQAPDGHFTWTAGRDMNPVWTTAYAVSALAGKPYPVAVMPAVSAGTGVEEEVPGTQEAAAEAEGQAGEEKGEGLEGVPAGEGESLATGSTEKQLLAESASQQEVGGNAWAWWLAGALAALALLGSGAWFVWYRLTETKVVH